MSLTGSGSDAARPPPLGEVRLSDARQLPAAVQLGVAAGPGALGSEQPGVVAAASAFLAPVKWREGVGKSAVTTIVRERSIQSKNHKMVLFSISFLQFKGDRSDG